MGVLKSYACYENFINTFESQFDSGNVGIGAAVFSLQGELVGISQSWKKDRLISTKSHLLHDLLFNSKLKLEVSKEKMEVGKAPRDINAFEREVYKNIVEIIVL